VIGLAAFLVSLASLAWTIYRDLKKNSKKPAREVLNRRVRVQIGEPKGVSITERDRIIDVVVEETFQYGDT
jgi:hypothetical protein